MRLFVAVYPPPVVVEDLVKTLSTLAIGQATADGVNVRLTVPERMHVTLAFLGEVPDTRLADVRTAIGAGVTAWAATWPRPTPPVVTVAGGGRFGRGRFTVLWAGLRGEVDALHDLATAVRRQLRRARLPYDPKPLRPHVTVARPGDRLPAEVIAADRAALDKYAGPPFGVDEIRLVRSYPGPDPRYEHLATWPLRAA